MKLIGSVTSPYVRKVRVVLAEKKLDYTFELENVWASETTIHLANQDVHVERSEDVMTIAPYHPRLAYVAPELRSQIRAELGL